MKIFLKKIVNVKKILVTFFLGITLFFGFVYFYKAAPFAESTEKTVIYDLRFRKAADFPSSIPKVHSLGNINNTQLPDLTSRRVEKMRGLGIGCPSEYYTMKLGDLRKLAYDGDAYAMLQLAEQYLNEDARLRNDPEYPTDGTTKDLAKQYLSNAFIAGRIRAAALLSKELFDENQIAEAYVWRLVSERVGDGVNPLWPGDSNQFASISDDQRLAAENKAASLINMLEQSKMREADNARMTVINSSLK